MHTSETDVRNTLSDVATRDVTGQRAAVVLLDEGDSTWDGAQGKITRARGGGTIIGAVYVETLDGRIATRPIQNPVRS